MKIDEFKQRTSNLLDDVKATITEKRQDNYGNPEDNFHYIARMWTAYLNAQDIDITLEAFDVAHMMALLKIVRIANSNQKADSYRDALGYLTIAAINSATKRD